MNILTVSETRKTLTGLTTKLLRKKSDRVLQVTSNGKPALALLPWETYESMAATLSMLANKKIMSDIVSYEKLEDSNELEEINWPKLKAELGL